MISTDYYSDPVHQHNIGAFHNPSVLIKKEFSPACTKISMCALPIITTFILTTTALVIAAIVPEFTAISSIIAVVISIAIINFAKKKINQISQHQINQHQTNQQITVDNLPLAIPFSEQKNISEVKKDEVPAEISNLKVVDKENHKTEHPENISKLIQGPNGKKLKPSRTQIKLETAQKIPKSKKKQTGETKEIEEIEDPKEVEISYLKALASQKKSQNERFQENIDLINTSLTELLECNSLYQQTLDNFDKLMTSLTEDYISVATSFDDAIKSQNFSEIERFAKQSETFIADYNKNHAEIKKLIAKIEELGKEIKSKFKDYTQAIKETYSSLNMFNKIIENLHDSHPELKKTDEVVDAHEKQFKDLKEKLIKLIENSQKELDETINYLFQKSEKISLSHHNNKSSHVMREITNKYTKAKNEKENDTPETAYALFIHLAKESLHVSSLVAANEKISKKIFEKHKILLSFLNENS